MNKYIDIHNHSLFDIDDGSKSIEESISILQKLKKLGYTDIILTPHFIEGTTYDCNNIEKYKKLKMLLNKNIVNLYLGNEVYILKDLLENINKNNIYSLNGSNYVLIEFSFNNKPINIENYILKLKNTNIIPIIAHPERYVYVQDNYQLVKSWIESGALLQGNLESITGKYGKKAQKTVKKLLVDGCYHFLATDVHKENSSLFLDFSKIIKLLKKEINDDYLNILMYENPKRVINNEKIKRENINVINKKKNIFNIINFGERK